MKRLRLWARALLRPSLAERELEEEFKHHLELEIENNLRKGMRPRAARRKALADFGGVERFKEQTRDVRRTRSLEDLVGDLKHAVRGLGKTPGFTTITVLTLAIGIGANTAIFSVVSGVLLKPLPFSEAENLVYIDSYFAPESGYDFANYPVGSPEYFDYKNQNRSMEEIAAVSTELITLTEGQGDPEVIAAGWVSPSMFTVLRTPPFLGRTLVEEDGGADPARVVVLNYDLWQRRFGGDSTVVGRQIDLGMELSEAPVTAEIVGVMPYGFNYPRRDIQLWGPLPLDPARSWRGGHWFDMIARLNRGVTLEAAGAEMATLMDQWETTYPDHHVGHGLQVRSLLEEEVGESRTLLLLLMGSVGFVLLIACANVASLLLARAEGRRREVAVRSALGAGRGRLLRQVLTESLVLASTGGALALLLAWGGVRGLLALEAGAIPRVEEIGLDPSVLAFTAGVVLLTTLLFGLAPALRESGAEAAEALRAAGRRTTATVSRVRFRKGLVVAEVALGVLLVVGAGLLIRSFQRLLEEDPGFPTQDLFFARMSLPGGDYSPEEAVVFYDQLLERTKALPMVVDATLLSRPPLLWRDQGGRMHIEGRPVAPTAPLCCMVDAVSVGEGVFTALGVPLLSGRLSEPGDHDIDAPSVAWVDRAAADRWWPGEDPVGQRVRFGSEESPWSTVVGVVGNVTFDGPGVSWPHFFHPHNPTALTHPFITLSSYLTVRTTPDAPDVGIAIRDVVREIDPGLALAGSYTMDEILDQAVARPRFVMTLLSVFAGVALVLGAIGIYGVMSFGVALRSGEIGIRRALGAGEGEVLGMVLRQGLTLAVVGLGLGLAGALAGTRVLEGFLHEVSPTDPLTFGLVGIGVVVVALLAVYLPARRASGVDPLEALRVE